MIVKQLGGAHGGASRFRGQQPALIVGEKDGVDQFGLAAGEFRDEGDHQAVAFQSFKGFVEAKLNLRRSHAMVFQPLFIFVDGVRYIHFPAVIGTHLFLKAVLIVRFVISPCEH